MASSSADSFPDRTQYATEDTVRYIWRGLGLPLQALDSLHLEGSGHGAPSSFKVGHLAQASIALSALTAALYHSLRTASPVPEVTVSLQHALAEFKSEALYTLDGKPGLVMSNDIGGLHKTSDGHVRVHDGFPNHRNGALELVGLPHTATREEFGQALLLRKALELERQAFSNKVVIAALRSFSEWDQTAQAQAVQQFPITLRRISDSSTSATIPPCSSAGQDCCLRGVRVLELSRVVAAPVAGRTLAAHGADVLWITSPNLPSLPTLDIDTSRGKRTAQLDLTDPEARSKLWALVQDADVFLQSYRPGSLASRGFSASALAKVNPGIIYASLSAYGEDGPWSSNRGFDSIVQTCSGLNVAEAEWFGEGQAARPLPCQALDHASGYFLAAGISAALYKRAVEGGSWEVHVSLAGTMQYLRSLGQLPKGTGLSSEVKREADGCGEFMESMDTVFGSLRAVRHSAAVKGAMPGCDIPPKALGSDLAEWLA